jgi:AraC-like DNA-binding protein
MPGSVTSVFGEPEDFEAALRADGVLSLLVIGHRSFRARLTQVTLHDLRLLAGDEYLPRIAFIAVPADTVLVSLPVGSGPWPVWSGMELQATEIITLGPDQRVYARTDGPCWWGAIRIPGEDLAEYARALSGAEFVVPPAARWRPPRAALKQLGHFHGAAVRRVEARSAVLADREAAHGLEQQIIEAVVECLSTGPVEEETRAAARHRAILAHFEDLLQSEPLLDTAEICATLGASERTLRECCDKHLGMAPSRYRRLRGMQQVHHALRERNSGDSQGR